MACGIRVAPQFRNSISLGCAGELRRLGNAVVEEAIARQTIHGAQYYINGCQSRRHTVRNRDRYLESINTNRQRGAFYNTLPELPLITLAPAPDFAIPKPCTTVSTACRNLHDL